MLLLCRSCRFPAVAQRLFPMVQIALWTIVVPQLLLDMVVNAPTMQVCRLSKSPSWRLPDHRHSPVAGHGDRRPCFAGRAGRRFSCRGTEADSNGPDFSSDHIDFPVAPQGDRCPCLLVVQVVHIPVVAPRLTSMVLTAQQTIVAPQLLYM